MVSLLRTGIRQEISVYIILSFIIVTQVATHKILGVRSPLSLKVIDSPQDFVASNFSLRRRKHNLEDYATKTHNLEDYATKIHNLEDYATKIHNLEDRDTKTHNLEDRDTKIATCVIAW